jgi:hypothetical protein
MLACYEVLIAEIFWFGQQTAYDSSLVVWTRRNANDYTAKTLASTARQQNDFCGFRCVIRPIQKMFKLKSFFTLIFAVFQP